MKCKAELVAAKSLLSEETHVAKSFSVAEFDRIPIFLLSPATCASVVQRTVFPQTQNAFCLEEALKNWSDIFPVVAPDTAWKTPALSDAEKLQLYERLLREFTLDYNFHRLLAHYQASLMRQKNIPAEKFCSEEYIKSWERDQGASEAGLNPKTYRSEKRWKFAADLGLTESELDAIREYSNSYYAEINQTLWGKKPFTRKLQLYQKILDAGLDRLPPYNDSEVFRTTNMAKETASLYQPGEIVCHKAYTSTSKKAGWDFGGKFHFTIRLVKQGKRLQDFADLPREEEVLIRAGSCFRILTRAPDEKNPERERIVMEEVNEPN